MSQHPCEHLPLKALLAADCFDMPLEPRQAGSKCLLCCGRIAAIQPGFQRFHEQFRTSASSSAGDPVQPGAELLWQKELMPNLLRLHTRPRRRNTAGSYCGSETGRDWLSDAAGSI